MVNNESAFSYPESDQIEPEQARFLYEEHCAILILEDLPIGSEFGIDMNAYQVGEKFKGVKLIPPGIHFIYASAIDRNRRQVGPRCGFFYSFKAKELLIKKWSISEEDFEDSHRQTDGERDKYLANLKDLDRFLGAYSFSTYRTFLNLTSELKPEIVASLMPDCNRIRSVPYLVRGEPSSCSMESNKRRTIQTETNNSNLTEENLMTDLQPEKTTVIHFTKIPEDRMESSEIVNPSLITQYNLDSTLKLNNTFKSPCDRQRLLAEFQFAFTCFLLCHVYECFEAWKRILELICKADKGLRTFPSFYTKFIQILRHQISQVPEDLFVDIVDSNNLIRSLLDTLFQNIQALEDEIDARDVLTCAQELKEHLEEKFGWQFDLEPDDEQPVVVEL